VNWIQESIHYFHRTAYRNIWLSNAYFLFEGLYSNSSFSSHIHTRLNLAKYVTMNSRLFLVYYWRAIFVHLYLDL
jgi:hypothetical protein